jgi:hypothetical protein
MQRAGARNIRHEPAGAAQQPVVLAARHRLTERRSA